MMELRHFAMILVAILFAVGNQAVAQTDYITVDAGPYSIGAIPFDYGDNIVVAESSIGNYDKCFRGRASAGVFQLSDLTIESGMDLFLAHYVNSSPGFSITIGSPDQSIVQNWIDDDLLFAGLRVDDGFTNFIYRQAMDFRFSFHDREVRFFINDILYNTDVLPTGYSYRNLTIENITQQDCLYSLRIVTR